MTNATRSSSASDEVGVLLCGGGARGAVQAGMMEEIEGAGINLSRILGVSVGAVNAAWWVAGMALGRPSPAGDATSMWLRGIQTSEDIARIPLTIQEIVYVPYLIVRAILHPDEQYRHLRRVRTIVRRLRREIRWRAHIAAALRHPARSTRHAYTTVNGFFTHLYTSSGLLDRSPIDRIIDAIDFGAVCRIADRVELVVATLNEATGEPQYFSSRTSSPDLLRKAVKASIAMPPQLACEVIDGVTYGDIGLVHPLPIRRLFEWGCKEVHVLATHPKSGPLPNTHLYREMHIQDVPAIFRMLLHADLRFVADYRRQRRWWGQDPRVIWHEVDAFPSTVRSTLHFEGPDDIARMIADGRAAAREALQSAGYALSSPKRPAADAGGEGGGPCTEQGPVVG